MRRSSATLQPRNNPNNTRFRPEEQNMIRLRIQTTLCALCALALAAPALAEDSVFGAKGVPIKGDITGTTPTEITISRAGAEQKIAVNEIRKVVLTGEPNELDKAREAIRQG